MTMWCRTPPPRDRPTSPRQPDRRGRPAGHHGPGRPGRVGWPAGRRRGVVGGVQPRRRDAGKIRRLREITPIGWMVERIIVGSAGMSGSCPAPMFRVAATVSPSRCGGPRFCRGLPVSSRRPFGAVLALGVQPDSAVPAPRPHPDAPGRAVRRSSRSSRLRGRRRRPGSGPTPAGDRCVRGRGAPAGDRLPRTGRLIRSSRVVVPPSGEGGTSATPCRGDRYPA